MPNDRPWPNAAEISNWPSKVFSTAVSTRGNAIVKLLAPSRMIRRMSAISFQLSAISQQLCCYWGVNSQYFLAES